MWPVLQMWLSTFQGTSAEGQQMQWVLVGRAEHSLTAQEQGC